MTRATRIDDVIVQHAGRLRALAGYPISWSRAVCAGSDGGGYELHAASPVVLGVAGQALELWSTYVSEFAMSWDTLDFTRTPFYWTRRTDESSRWVEDPVPALQRARGRLIQGVRLMEWDEMCGGVEFTLSDGGVLVVCNPGDDVLVTDEQPPWDGRWLSL